jgi:putative Ca2+/H+ antiporter (TMEM165/GDT1 family)
MAATVFLTIFIAELGDKTQLATLLFATRSSASKFTVFLSASLALILAVGIGVLAGALVADHVSDRLLRYVAGIGFLAIGIWTLLTA